MSKLYLKYLKNKNNDKDKYYLFKSGMFYIFLDEDAKKISEYLPLKITNLNKDIVKCGFPKDSLNKYLEIFKNINIDVVIVNDDDKDNIDKIIKMIKDIDINELTPIKSFDMINKFKELLNE